ncbi:hypothetical protein EDB81DRAFT_761956 [Dactylonectria macrodidyma]|uniref:Peptidase M61 catalytic domain-containing protein n=1 Tax=Dactylonectria macrodidyma TaxID=307937 RepID=A0A9P9IZ51_9HYPO|nr:hypothetical protein EDB81DRAFT_761956 [Dactylonectria macrodidyma]
MNNLFLLFPLLSFLIVAARVLAVPAASDMTMTTAEFGSTDQLLDYTLTPLYNNQVAKALRVHVKICQPSIEVGATLLATPIEITQVDVGHFEDDAIIAEDSNGPLSLTRKVDKFGPPVVYQNWQVSRQTSGIITATYTALPRQVNSSTKNGPSFELRQNFGGLLGSGLGFLTVPPSTGSEKRFYNTTVRWNLSEAPEGTRAVWTWAEGPDATTRRIELTEIPASYFMVGKIQSITDGDFGMYWLGDPPFNTTEIANQLKLSHQWMREFFDDQEQVYRVFIRYNPFRGSRAGTALKRSFMFSYDDEDRAQPASLSDYLLFLSHEMVHNWPALDTGVEENWYTEGLAEYYSLILNRRAGLISDAQLCDEMNSRLTMYYTNSLASLTNVEVAKLTWTASEAQRIPYGRGLVFALKLNALIQKGSQDREQSIDNLVLELLDRSRLEQLGGLLTGGRAQAQALYDSMASGDLVIPEVDSLGDHGLKLIRQDAPVWELGFNERDAIQGKRVVSGLVPGSAAANAGLRNGDRICSRIDLDSTRSDLKAVLKLRIERSEGEEMTISFVPRSNIIAERWIYINEATNGIEQITNEL